MKKIGTKREVYEGRAEQTKGGSTAADLVKVPGNTPNQRARIKFREKRSINSGLQMWNEAIRQAKIQLEIPENEFILMKKNTKLYKTAKSILEKMKKEQLSTEDSFF